MIQAKNKAKLIAGIVILVLNLLWTGYWIWLFYGYHFTNKLWLYMYPDWVLALNSFIGLIGIYVGYSLIRDKMAIWQALVLDIPLLLLGLIVSYYI